LVTLIVLILIVAYFAPTIVAMLRKHADGLAIGALNFLLGWSVVGWIVSLVWSLSDPRGRGTGQTVVVNTTQNLAAPYSPYPASQQLSEPPRPDPPPVNPRIQQGSIARNPSPPALTAGDADTAFWDGLPNKSDPDSLEEYLIRFPDGRFAVLARARLQRAGILLPSSTQVRDDTALSPGIRPSATVETVCAACGEAWEEETRFCSGCGARRPLGAVA